MDIGIIGLGMVGSACKYGFEKLGHNIKSHDIKLNTKIEDVLDAEICYICVPSNPKEDGSCDTSIVEASIDTLNNLKYRGLVVIKSTVEPGTTQKLIGKYPECKICFVPEFLRERMAAWDFTEGHSLLAVGTYDKQNYDLVVKCHGKYPKKTAMLSPTEAELLKYYSNIFNALRITFSNEFYDVCQALGANYNTIKEAFMLRKTATDMYMDVNENFRGYGGYCLPKDTQAIATLVKKLNLDLDLFDCIERENKKFKTTVFEGMRMGIE